MRSLPETNPDELLSGPAGKDFLRGLLSPGGELNGQPSIKDAAPPAEPAANEQAKPKIVTACADAGPDGIEFTPGRSFAFGILYALSNFLVYKYLLLPHFFALIWIPQGLVLYALLASRSVSAWYMIVILCFASDLLVPLMFGHSLTDCGFYAASNQIEAILAAALYRMSFRHPLRLRGSSDIFALLATSVLASLAASGINSLRFEQAINMPAPCEWKPGWYYGLRICLPICWQ